MDRAKSIWTWVRTIGSRAVGSIRRTPLDRALDAEVREHLTLLEQRFRDRGLSDQDARREARRAFGNIAQLTETHREARALMWVDRTVQDAGYAVRMLRRNPGFAAVAILTLALGIGANTAVFTVVNGLLLRPLPYPDADRLVRIGWDWDGSGQVTPALSSLKFDYVRRFGRVFESLATWSAGTLDLGPRGEDGLVRALSVSDDFFAAVGFHPTDGRAFSSEEQTPGGPPVVILTAAAWRAHFPAGRSAIGDRLTLDDREYVIVGVMPPAFEFPEESSRVDVILPLQFQPDPRAIGANSPALGRLRPGVPKNAALGDVDRVMERLRAEHPHQLTEPSERARLVDVGKIDLRGFQTTLWTLLAAVGLVLLIACANVAGLVLARMSARGREMALRTALGATRARIARQVITESLVLGISGGVVGLAAGLFGVRMLIRLAPAGVPGLDAVAMDGRVLAFTAGIAVLTGVVFGLASALPSAGMRLTGRLKSGHREGIGPRRARQRALLVSAEASLTMMLLAGAGLLTSSLIQLHRTDLGFDPNGVLTMSFRRMPDVYRNPERAADVSRRLRQRLETIPGIQSVASTSVAPLGARGLNIPMTVDGRPDATEGAAEWRVVSPDYFTLLGMSLARGRAFTDDDARSARPIVIVNESFARRYWPNGDAIGHRIRLGVFRGEVRTELAAADPTRRVDPIPREIVGVVADTRELGPVVPARRTIFLPNADRAGLPVFLIRSDGPVPAEAFRAVVRDVDAALPAPILATLGERLGDRVAETRFATLLLTLFAGVALALTAVGVYGMVSWAVRSRTAEIGIRMALGADRRAVVGRLVAGGMLPVVIGLGIGVAGGMLGTRALEGMLHGVTKTDPLSFAAAAVALAVVGLVAACLPAQRAARIDPASALRSD